MNRITHRFCTACLVAASLASSVSTLLAQSTTARATRSIPSSAAESVVVAFSGEMRTRSEWDRPGGGMATDVFTMLRSRLGVRVEATSNVRIVLQVQDSRVLGAEGNPSAAIAESFGLHQGYLELYAPWRGTRVALRAGRQEIAIGNERLVGVVKWSNVGRSFDGARVTLGPARATPGTERWSVSGFAATVEERGRHFGVVPATATATATATSTSQLRDHIVLGLFAARDLAGKATAELTLLDDESGRYRGYTRSTRTTIHGRIRSPRVLGMATDIEGALQRGHQVDSAPAAAGRRQAVVAWMAGARASKTFDAPTRMSFTLGADVLSGDATPHDGRYSTFNTLYASNHAFYGLIDAIGEPAATTRERGLVDALVTASIRVSKAMQPRLELHRFRLATGSHRELGWEADVMLPVQLSPVATMDVGYSAFRAGSGAAAVGLGGEGTRRNWVFVQLRAGF